LGKGEEAIKAMNQMKLTGHEAMLAWNKTFKIHHIPKWLKPKINATIVLRDWSKYDDNRVLSYPLFDHWGSAWIKHIPVIITQPYNDVRKEALCFAESMNLNIDIKSGVWNEGTTMYCFWLKMYGKLQ
jgi:hypothetical protein